MSGDGKSKRRALPVVAEEPADWGAEVLLALVRVQYRIEKRMSDIVAAHGMTLAQFDVLATLLHGEGITQQDLAERLLVTKGNVVGLIDRLCAAGWVERHSDPCDRRANLLYLTPPGRKRLAAALPGVHDQRNQLFCTFKPGELRQMYQFLRRLEDVNEE